MQPKRDEDLEKQPLLKKQLESSSVFDEEEDYVEEEDMCLGCVDPMTYGMKWLKSWSVFLVFKQTVWENSTLWYMMFKLMIISIAVAILMFFAMTDPSQLEPDKFSTIVTFVNTFVSIMLGFFLSDSIKRWSSCVDGFLMLMNSIRNLSMQFHALGAQSKFSDQCLRYGVLSAYFLHNELKRNSLRAEHRKDAELAMWQRLERNRSRLQAQDSKRYVTEKEHMILQGINDCSGQMWLWVASLIGRMAQDDEVPGMASSTYGRIIDLCQDAQCGVRQVRSSMFVRVPFVYVHTLATLVHITNMLLAVSLGLTIGASSTGILHYAKSLWNPKPTNELLPIVYIQTIVIQFIKCIIGPLLYQAFFEIGCTICSPFNHAQGAIPVIKLLKVLERDLTDSNRLAANGPGLKKA